LVTKAGQWLLLHSVVTHSVGQSCRTAMAHADVVLHKLEPNSAETVLYVCGCDANNPLSFPPPLHAVETRLAFSGSNPYNDSNTPSSPQPVATLTALLMRNASTAVRLQHTHVQVNFPIPHVMDPSLLLLPHSPFQQGTPHNWPIPPPGLHHLAKVLRKPLTSLLLLLLPLELDSVPYPTFRQCSSCSSSSSARGCCCATEQPP
jgi:hypothetical protein